MKILHRVSGIVVLLIMIFALAVPAAAQDSDDGRPELPDEQTFGTTHFLIHYTLRGDHAVDAADNNADGTPDYVEEMAATLEFVWQIEISA